MAACLHNFTAPAEWPRWRFCMICSALVHRIETNHYAKLFVPPKIRVMSP